MGSMRYGCKIMAIALAACLVGCTGPDVPAAKQTTGRAPQVAEVPNAEETVRGGDDPAVVTLDLGTQLKEQRITRGDDLPANIIVPSTNLNAVPVTTALQAVLAGTDVSLSWEAGAFDDRLVSVTNLSGALPRVVEKICSSAKVFCNYRNGLMELKDKDTFIIELPTMPTKAASSGAATNTMAEAIGDLAGQEVRIDQQGGKLIYTTDVEGQGRVREYLSQLRNGRPLVVMQLYIWEVTLNKESAAGINWKSFSFDKIGGRLENLALASTAATAFTEAASPGVSLGAKFSGHVDADSVMKFLATQGQVQTISNPQLTFVSGSNAEFKVGGTQRYISQVGQLTTGSLTGSNASNAGVGTNTVSTDSINTGLTVNVGGVLESGIISAVLELEMKDVKDLNPTTNNGVTIDLPETTERKVSTSLRVRPGDNLVLAGLVTSRDNNSRDGIPLPFGGRIPMSSDDQFNNSEMVILVKPSVVLFSDAGAVAEAKQKDKAKDQPLPPMNAVVIDKDGPKTLNMPDNQPVSLQQPRAAAAPAVAQYSNTNGKELYDDPTAFSMKKVPIAPSEDGAPVDRRLLQRGFSHAFDELMATPSGKASGGGQ